MKTQYKAGDICKGATKTIKAPLPSPTISTDDASAGGPNPPLRPLILSPLPKKWLMPTIGVIWGVNEASQAPLGVTFEPLSLKLNLN